jgi:small subunit ribosomal protein S6
LRKYEVMLILSVDADDSVVGGAVDRIGRVVQERGGSVTKVDKWGKRRLAYEILRQSEGFYVVVDCLGDPTAMPELDRVLNLADEVMRFKIVVRGEADGQGAASSEGPSAPEAAAEAVQSSQEDQPEQSRQDDQADQVDQADQAASDEPAAREASAP